MNSIQQKILSSMESIHKNHLYRTLRPPCGIDLCSNDYLGLSNHPSVKENLIRGIEILGAGSSASRLIRGHREVFEETEDAFANWVGSENCIFLANGYVANTGLLYTLGDVQTHIFTDRLNHASILDGIRLSKGFRHYYNHLDYDHLENQLKKIPFNSSKLIVSETVFSMDGDIASVENLVELKSKYNACLILDEAHAIGVFGNKGSGICKMSNISNEIQSQIDFRVYTAGKALGLEGAIIACSHLAKDYLINTMRNFIFSTAPIPAIVYALKRVIELVCTMDHEREQIACNSEYLRKEFCKMNYDSKNSCTQIIPMLLIDSQVALNFSSYLLDNDFDVRAIRPPTVKQPRLRFSLNSKIRREDLERLVQCIRSYKNN